MKASNTCTRRLSRFAKCVLSGAAPIFILTVNLLFASDAHAAASADAAPSAAHSADAAPVAAPWGVSSSASSFKTYEAWFPQMQTAGVRTVRLFPEWPVFEPTEGSFRWDKADSMVKSAGDNGLQISGILFGAMPWGKAPGHSFPMEHLDDWGAYVSSLVGHYKGKIENWEVWNEGNAGFNDLHNTTADYAALAARAYEAAKKADPNAQVGLSVASFDAPYLGQAMIAMTKMGKPNSFDYLCIHPYETLEVIREPNGEIPYLWMARMLRDELKANAPARADAPIWITEIGMPVNKKASEDDAAKALLKSYVMAVAEGISKIMWFEARDPVGEEAGFGLSDREGKPRAAYGSLKIMTACLGQNPKYRGWVALGADAKGYGFAFEGASAAVMVAWAPVDDADDAVTFDGNVRLIDGLTGAASALTAGQSLKLTNTPVFIVDIPAGVLSKAQGNMAKNFPWGGDFSTAKTVELQLGLSAAGHGIFLRNPKGYKPYQFPDGSSGIEIRNNASTSFYIHPSFASINTRDYYIRLTLRRLGPGNAGMNINYEVADTQGQRGPMRHNGGWYSVAPDTGWQTRTWHVTDASFAKMWGYDFSFNPEQSVPFVIGKVEVSTEPFAK